MAFCLTLVFLAFFWLVSFTQLLLCICSFQITFFWHSRLTNSFESSWSFSKCYSFHSGQCHCLHSCSLQSLYFYKTHNRQHSDASMAFCLILVFIAFFWLVRFTQSLLCICSFQITFFWYSRRLNSFKSSWSFNTCYSFQPGQCHCLNSCSLQSSYNFSIILEHSCRWPRLSIECVLDLSLIVWIFSLLWLLMYSFHN